MISARVYSNYIKKLGVEKTKPKFRFLSIKSKWLIRFIMLNDRSTWKILFFSPQSAVGAMPRVYQALDQPYIIKEERDYDNNFENNRELLDSVFGQAIDYIKNINDNTENTTILLVDLDDVILLSSSSSTITSYVQEIIRDLNDMLPDNVPLVVCSKRDDPNIMMDCIHAGASDFLLKPFHLNIIKTLFLKLHRFQPKSPLLNAPLNSELGDNHRVKDMIFKDSSQLTDILLSEYLPPKLSSNTNSTIKIEEKRSAELQSKISQLYDFLVDLSNAYHDENPYHNFAHAVDVLQCLFYMLCEIGVLPSSKRQKQKRQLIRPIDAFALLIAAIGHDAAHPGVNNMFLVNSGSPLAILFNDKSILESLHSMTLFQILNKHGINQLFGNATSESYKEFRKTIVTSILATDMALHADYMSKFKDQAIRLQRMDLNTLSKEELENERLLMCSALIKCADISNVARPYRWCTKWAELLVEEFTTQGELEKKLALPVLNDRDTLIMEDFQIGFIKFVALNLFQSVREMLSDISFAVDQMQANLKQWEMQRKSVVMHDSGVSNLTDDFDNLSDAGTPMIIEAGSKRSNTDEPVEFLLHKRILLEKKEPLPTGEQQQQQKSPFSCQCIVQ
ncbi:HD-domain/PDEase-like protein [Backusella circina FSU 941]|nr:HD-domain/PDEase-like protein [Backusella circina FSU 941]